MGFVHRQLQGGGLISDYDLKLFKVTDDVNEAVAEIQNFYSNYHSSRYVRDRLVLRVRVAPDPEQLAALNEEFADLLSRGPIEVGEPLREENSEAPEHARVVLRFDRKRVGRLRELIDRLNGLVAEPAAPPLDASPHEIFASDFSPEMLSRQEEEEA